MFWKEDKIKMYYFSFSFVLDSGKECGFKSEEYKTEQEAIDFRNELKGELQKAVSGAPITIEDIGIGSNQVASYWVGRIKCTDGRVA